MSNYMVVISKKFNDHQIHYTLEHDGLELKIELTDYIKALLGEIGSPALLFKKSSLEAKINAASTAILENMKNATIHRPPPMVK
jgi:hypothetical protein